MVKGGVVGCIGSAESPGSVDDCGRAYIVEDDIVAP